MNKSTRKHFFHLILHFLKKTQLETCKMQISSRIHLNLKHRARAKNKAANALSRSILPLVNMSATTTGFDELKHDCNDDDDLGR